MTIEDEEYEKYVVSIPTTVSGGLQFNGVLYIVISVDTFQYRQRYQEGYNHEGGERDCWSSSGFNTDNGIRRATILCP